MPKTIKLRNNKRAISLSNIDEINSWLDRETNVSFNTIDNFSTDIKPSFIPTLTTNDLIKNATKPGTLNKNRAKTLPNAFIAYRMALTKEYRNKNKLPLMGQLSRIAKDFWKKEPQNIKNFYKTLAEDAKSLYNQNTIQFVFDKHMNKFENDQEGGRDSSFTATNEICGAGSNNVYQAEGAEVLPVEDAQNSSNVNHPTEDLTASPNYSFFEDLCGMNSADRELFYLLDFHFKINT
ncbi:17397_t:CDS:1 [Funneliformis geosporum]|uniref:4608_t:CDS:1 n=1 Tax=Funneliformis geosporum TaxID=1117311 RepID=A0A9W4SY38_9GLOM|nr:4608_t:CDS:1 [Funneliformis geosporum]CAI2186400.1 17397_t:CDS:1 [Funneliformis geosporum]